MRNAFRLLLLMVMSLFTALAVAQQPVKWSSTYVGDDKEGVMTVTATIDDKWHLYSIKEVKDGPFPTTFSSGDAEIIGDVKEGDPIREVDPNFGVEVGYFAKTAVFEAKVKLGSKGKEGGIKVRFQACDDSRCLPPQTFDLPLNGEGVLGKTRFGAATSPEASTGGTTTPSEGTTTTPDPKASTTKKLSDVEKAKKEGLFAYIKLAITAGFVALLTPCVFPMIPITVSFFSKKSKEGGMKEVLKQALAYCGGIVGTFTILGIVASLLFGAAGVTTLANNPWMNLVLAIIFIVLAFSLFGVFEFALPPALLNRFSATGKTGLIAPILMGLTFSLTSFTCTLPFVGAVLVSASQGDFLYPIIGMLCFSTAFCLPFFALALWPQALSKLPKSGAWLATIKAYMGFIELMAAVKFLSSTDLGLAGGLGILTRETFLAVWFGLLLLAGLYLVGSIKLPTVHEEGRPGPFRLVLGIATIVLSGFVLSGLNGKALGDIDAFLPPSPYPNQKGETTAKGEGGFLSTYAAAQEESKRTGKPIFIDFTGIYCTNCRYMERNVFPDAAVQKEFEKYVKVKLFTDRPTSEDMANQKLMQDLTKSITLPQYVIVKPDGSVEVKEFTRDVKAFAAWLGS